MQQKMPASGDGSMAVSSRNNGYNIFLEYDKKGQTSHRDN